MSTRPVKREAAGVHPERSVTVSDLLGIERHTRRDVEAKEGFTMKRSYIKRKPVRREWGAAIIKRDREGRCRACGRSISELLRLGRKLEACHILGRTFDVKQANGVRLVDENSIVPLCGPAVDSDTCHCRFDGGTLDVWEILTGDEREWAIGRVGEGQARRRISGRIA